MIRRGPADGGILGEDQCRESAKNAADHAQRQEVAGAKFHARLQQCILHGRDPGGAAQQSVEGGNLAELFVAHQGEFFVRFALRRLLHGGETIFDEAGLALRSSNSDTTAKVARATTTNTRSAINSAGM